MIESKFLEIYRRHQESGLTTKEFCSNEGIAESTYYYWFKKTKYRRVKQEFIPLVVKPSPGVPAQSYINNNHPHVHESRNTGEGMLLEVEYPNGTRLRIKQDLDLAHLRTLVCLLD
jgi:hypothetical protein